MFLFIYHIYNKKKPYEEEIIKKEAKEKFSGDGMMLLLYVLYIHVLLLFCYHDDECYGNKIIE